MRKALRVGDRIVQTRTGRHGVILDRQERGGGLGFVSIRVHFDDTEKPERYYMSLSGFLKEKREVDDSYGV